MTPQSRQRHISYGSVNTERSLAHQQSHSRRKQRQQQQQQRNKTRQNSQFILFACVVRRAVIIDYANAYRWSGILLVSIAVVIIKQRPRRAPDDLSLLLFLLLFPFLYQCMCDSTLSPLWHLLQPPFTPFIATANVENNNVDWSHRVIEKKVTLAYFRSYCVWISLCVCVQLFTGRLVG
mgnify:CR=1 FL=1